MPAAVPVTAYGAELKSTICVAKGGRAWPSHHIGDLENWETLRSFREAVEHFERVFAVEPRVVAHDLHPEYLSTKEALERAGAVRLVAVQHHHAHLAACLAEHGRTGPALGVIYDGTGYGTDGTVWGGELLAGGLEGFERAAHLWPVRLPGGERAIREPWRMACAWLTEIEGGEPAPLAGVDPERWSQVAALCRGDGAAAPVTTSAGRLCDAVAALCGVRTEVTYEGQAAIELEALADERRPDFTRLCRAKSGQRRRWTAASSWPPWSRTWPRAPIRPPWPPASTPRFAAGHRRRGGRGRGGARAWTRSCSRAACSRTACCSSRPPRACASTAWSVLRPERLPPNDGGIAYGQAAVAARHDV